MDAGDRLRRTVGGLAALALPVGEVGAHHLDLVAQRPVERHEGRGVANAPAPGNSSRPRTNGGDPGADDVMGLRSSCQQDAPGLGQLGQPAGRLVAVAAVIWMRLADRVRKRRWMARRPGRSPERWRSSTASAQPTGSRWASADQSWCRARPDRWATSDGSMAPVHRMALRMASMTRLRAPRGSSPAAYTAARMWCAGDPFRRSRTTAPPPRRATGGRCAAGRPGRPGVGGAAGAGRSGSRRRAGGSAGRGRRTCRGRAPRCRPPRRRRAGCRRSPGPA